MRILLPFLLAIAGCSTAQLTAPTELPLYKNRASIQITVDGKAFDGMAVSKLDGPKDITIVSQAALDLLRITSCHRDFTIQKVDQNWFGGSGKKYVYHYDPTEKEKTPVCPLYIEAYSKDLVTDWGYVAFRTDETLAASMDCNGTKWDFAGISICQTKAGLDQIIRFDRPVKFSADASCQISANSDRAFTIRGTLGFCYAEFSDGKIWHRLILLGYEQVLVR